MAETAIVFVSAMPTTAPTGKSEISLKYHLLNRLF